MKNSVVLNFHIYHLIHLFKSKKLRTLSIEKAAFTNYKSKYLCAPKQKCGNVEECFNTSITVDNKMLLLKLLLPECSCQHMKIIEILTGEPVLVEQIDDPISTIFMVKEDEQSPMHQPYPVLELIQR